MKVAIIEDEKSHADLLAGYIQSWGKQRQISVDIRNFFSAESFLFHWDIEKDFDLLFVDIQMKEMNGVDMAKTIRERDLDIMIVFTTGISDYIQEGYEVEAMHYLLKPIDKEKVEQCMDRARSRIKEKNFILVHHFHEIRKLNVESINYVEARGHGCILGMVKQLSDTYQELEVLESISELETLLSPYGFFKCHRSYLFHVEKVHHIDKKELYFDNGSHIPISRRLYGEVNQIFIKHFKRV